MKFDQLVVLLPCRTLEDLTLQRPADEAEQLLSAWCALWHPLLLAATGTTPKWIAAEEAPEDPAGQMIVLPSCCEPLLPEGWFDRAASAGGCLIRGLQRRDEMVAAALRHLDPPQPEVEQELSADFLAAAFCYFVVELVTRQLRYASNLDELSFRSEMLAAAEAAVKPDVAAARGRLEEAFRLLGEARDYFYPVEGHLIDLTLVAPSTLGAMLRCELAADVPHNLLVSGEVIAEMARREPATLTALQQALENNKAALLGGEYREAELPLLPPEAIRTQIIRGLAVYREHLGVRPVVFGRRRFGLTPVLPQILQSLGFTGAMHATLDDGQFPVGNQSRMPWEGFDGTALDVLARLPIDVNRADAMLALPEKLGNWLDLDHVATVVLAHWPGQSSPWYDDLRRIAAYCSVMGTFATITDYFEQTSGSGQRAQYHADKYRSPYLRQAVASGQVDPISRWVRYYRRRATVEAAESLNTLAAVVRGFVAEADPAEPAAATFSCVKGLFCEVDDALAASDDAKEGLDQRLLSNLDEAARAFCRALGGSPGSEARQGYFVANPWSFPRRLPLEMPALSAVPDVAGVLRAAGEIAGKPAATLEVPAMGFAWVGAGGGSAPAAPVAPQGWFFKKKPKVVPPLAEEHTLRNEFVVVEIDPVSGAVRSISDYHSRGPRLAQQIALRWPQGAHDKDPGHDAHYSLMVADEVAVTSPGPLLGEIVSRGRLLDHEGQRLAGYRQTTRTWRGSRLVELEIELEIERLPQANPWASYYAARFAWADPLAELYRSVNMANRPTEAVPMEAPHFVEIRSGRLRTAVLSGGLPYHRRCGSRKLDTLLVVHGETSRRFRLAIGIDLPNPMAAAVGFLAPQTVLTAPAPPAPSGWLFHLDARNVVATHWEPTIQEGRVVGFRARLLETEGRNVRLRLRAPRTIQAAHKIKAEGSPSVELPLQGDAILLEMGPYAWVEVEAVFAGTSPLARTAATDSAAVSSDA